MPKTNELHVDAVLSQYASAYTNGATIADAVAPVISVTKRSDIYRTFSRENTATGAPDLLSPDAIPNRTSYKIGQDNYSVTDRGLIDYIPAGDMQEADNPLDPRRDSVDNIMAKLMFNREVRVAALYENTANYASGHFLAVANPWTNTSTGTPRADIESMINKLPAGDPERSELIAVFPKRVWQALRAHPDYNGNGQLSPVASMAAVAEDIGVDRILVPDFDKFDGSAYTKVWDETKCVFTRVTRSPNSRQGGMFCGTFRLNMGGNLVRSYNGFDAQRGTDGVEWVKTTFSDDEKVIQNDSAVLLTGVRA